MAFIFRLQKVLEYRKSLERDAEAELVRARQEYRERAAVLERTKRDWEQTLSAGISPEAGTAECYHRYLYIQHLRSMIFRQELEVQRAGEAEEKARKLLLKAMREREVLEKLKDRDLKAYLKETGRKERALEDELALYSYVRRKRN